ncbi:helix-turn-helix domain-containing protein [Shewanella acanthi]|uniref:helix-turn-helix domain-containing protein n=1 Tax=Shewanella acanthi TaxID=2864212 RepID=UPI001C65807B|nr:helix-turn-helix transcriptional regulator [Shewanella acanthi]QYJ77438.1 helix-turn-helix transcriptional regulator [Shewanella acanthi]
MSGHYVSHMVELGFQLAERLGASKTEIYQATKINSSWINNNLNSFYPNDDSVLRLYHLLSEQGYYHNRELIYLNKIMQSTPTNSLIVNPFNALMNTKNLQEFLLFLCRFQNVWRCWRVDLEIVGKYAYLTHEFTTKERDFNTSQGALFGLSKLIKDNFPNIEFTPEFLFYSRSIQDEKNFNIHCGDFWRFNQVKSALKFDVNLLNAPNPNHNPRIYTFTNKLGDVALLELEQQSSICGEVKLILERKIKQADTDLDINTIAYHLNTSRASLQRMLSKENSSFSMILEQVRKTEATNLLKNSNAKVSNISDVLGYTNVTAFNKAFKRWYGETPNDYRFMNKV